MEGKQAEEGEAAVDAEGASAADQDVVATGTRAWGSNGNGEARVFRSVSAPVHVPVNGMCQQGTCIRKSSIAFLTRLVHIGLHVKLVHV